MFLLMASVPNINESLLARIELITEGKLLYICTYVVRPLFKLKDDILMLCSMPLYGCKVIEVVPEETGCQPLLYHSQLFSLSFLFQKF